MVMYYIDIDNIDTPGVDGGREAKRGKDAGRAFVRRKVEDEEGTV